LITDGGYAEGTPVQLISEGATDFRSEFVLLGPAIPKITHGEMLSPDRIQLFLLGRAGSRYDIETADSATGTWRFVQQVLIPATNQLTWTNSNIPPNVPRRFYRMRYPSR
jgi:hypothetical protein